MRRLLIVLSLITGLLAALFVIAPLASPPGAYSGLDGTPGFIDHGWGFADIAYLIGDVLCHQMEDRCFEVNGSQMPVCVRDFGLILGFSVGAAACAPFLNRLDSNRTLAAALALMAVTVIEWAADTTIGDAPAWRFVTGTVSGAGVAMLLSWILNWSTKRNEQAIA